MLNGINGAVGAIGAALGETFTKARKHWRREDDLQLLQLFSEGKDAKYVAQELERTPRSVKERFQHLKKMTKKAKKTGYAEPKEFKKPGAKSEAKTLWSPTEENKLIELGARTDLSWEDVAKQFSHREATAQGVKSKYYTLLRDRNGTHHTVWTDEEKEKLAKAYTTKGMTLQRLVKLLKGRTSYAIMKMASDLRKEGKIPMDVVLRQGGRGRKKAAPEAEKQMAEPTKPGYRDSRNLDPKTGKPPGPYLSQWWAYCDSRNLDRKTGEPLPGKTRIPTNPAKAHHLKTLAEREAITGTHAAIKPEASFGQSYAGYDEGTTAIPVKITVEYPQSHPLGRETRTMHTFHIPGTEFGVIEVLLSGEMAGKEAPTILPSPRFSPEAAEKFGGTGQYMEWFVMLGQDVQLRIFNPSQGDTKYEAEPE